MSERRLYLREWRIFRNLTQKQVVDRLDSLNDDKLPTTEASLSRLETGKQPYSQRILEALADIYGIEPGDLIGRDPNKEGQVIDMWSGLNETQRRQASVILQALAKESVG